MNLISQITWPVSLHVQYIHTCIMHIRHNKASIRSMYVEARPRKTPVLKLINRGQFEEGGDPVDQRQWSLLYWVASDAKQEGVIFQAKRTNQIKKLTCLSFFLLMSTFVLPHQTMISGIRKCNLCNTNTSVSGNVTNATQIQIQIQIHNKYKYKYKYKCNRQWSSVSGNETNAAMRVQNSMQCQCKGYLQAAKVIEKTNRPEN